MRLALKIFNVAVLPLLVVLAGLLAWKRRSIRRKRVQAEFAPEVSNE